MRVETYLIAARSWVPNNAGLPVILYRAAFALASDEEMAVAFEAAFARHGWPAQWRDGIYDYDLYHSTAHQVLAIAAGSALLVLGGPGGRELEVSAGDALLPRPALATEPSDRATIFLSWAAIQQGSNGTSAAMRQAMKPPGAWPPCPFQTPIPWQVLTVLSPNIGASAVDYRKAIPPRNCPPFEHLSLKQGTRRSSDLFLLAKETLSVSGIEKGRDGHASVEGRGARWLPHSCHP